MPGYISEWGLNGAEYYFNVSTSNGREGESNQASQSTQAVRLDPTTKMFTTEHL